MLESWKIQSNLEILEVTVEFCGTLYWEAKASAMGVWRVCVRSQNRMAKAQEKTMLLRRNRSWLTLFSLLIAFNLGPLSSINQFIHTEKYVIQSDGCFLHKMMPQLITTQLITNILLWTFHISKDISVICYLDMHHQSGFRNSSLYFKTNQYLIAKPGKH